MPAISPSRRLAATIVIVEFETDDEVQANATNHLASNITAVEIALQQTDSIVTTAEVVESAQVMVVIETEVVTQNEVDQPNASDLQAAVTSAGGEEAELEGDWVSEPDVLLYMVGLDNTTLCPDGFREISSSAVCQEAAGSLGLVWRYVRNDPMWPSQCHHAIDGDSVGVFFNSASSVRTSVEIEPICQATVPDNDASNTSIDASNDASKDDILPPDNDASNDISNDASNDVILPPANDASNASIGHVNTVTSTTGPANDFTDSVTIGVNGRSSSFPVEASAATHSITIVAVSVLLIAGLSVEISEG
jgi:hypothetical protein